MFSPYFFLALRVCCKASKLARVRGPSGVVDLRITPNNGGDDYMITVEAKESSLHRSTLNMPIYPISHASHVGTPTVRCLDLPNHSRNYLLVLIMIRPVQGVVSYPTFC